jgi:hypothetical protein
MLLPHGFIFFRWTTESFMKHRIWATQQGQWGYSNRGNVFGTRRCREVSDYRYLTHLTRTGNIVLLNLKLSSLYYLGPFHLDLNLYALNHSSRLFAPNGMGPVKLRTFIASRNWITKIVFERLSTVHHFRCTGPWQAFQVSMSMGYCF